MLRFVAADTLRATATAIEEGFAKHFEDTANTEYNRGYRAGIEAAVDILRNTANRL